MNLETQFDGLVGPTHHYAGQSFGNQASMQNAQSISNPRAAALQSLKKLAFDRKNILTDDVAVIGANIGGKPYIAIGIADTVVAARQLDAGKIIKEVVAPLIKGGGGGQKNLATAGGQDPAGLQQVIDSVRNMLK